MNDPTAELGLERLQRAPVISRILASEGGDQTLKLIKATVAPDCTDAEVGHFLELCSVYGLDPFAREAWCAKGKARGGEPGRLLIMVGRDGLRKIAKRNGLGIDGDVVRENDSYSVQRHGDRTRTIEHGYEQARRVVAGKEKPDEVARGPIVGAWAECYDLKTGEQRGYFYAPLSEYKPAGVSQYSPWSKQESVMILAAAERQAIRQATPLGGLLAEGEDESAAAARTIGDGEGSGEGQGWGDMDPERVERVEAIIARAEKVGLPAFATPEVIQVRLGGQPVQVVEDWIALAERELEAVENVPEAEVVPEGEHEYPAGMHDGSQTVMEPEVVPEAEEPGEQQELS